MSEGIVLSLFDYSGKMVEPWAQAGYECWCVDIQHESGYRKIRNVVHVGADLLKWILPMPKEYRIVFAFPPCTHLACSGARWWKGKGLRALAESIELVARSAELCEESGAPWMIENPIGALSSHWRAPDSMFDPCDYGGYLNPPGDEYTKRTCLWTGNGFVIPLPKPVFPYEGSKMHLMSPSEDRANLRSETPAGFARAVFEANHKQTRRAPATLAEPTVGL